MHLALFPVVRLVPLGSSLPLGPTLKGPGSGNSVSQLVSFRHTLALTLLLSLLFSISLFFFFRFPLFFFAFFLSFSKDFRGSAKRKTLAFFVVFFQKKQGLEGQGTQRNIAIQRCEFLSLAIDFILRIPIWPLQIRSLPGKPNQRKGPKRKVHEFRPFFAKSGVFP